MNGAPTSSYPETYEMLYPIFLSIGVGLTIIASMIMLMRKRIPLIDFRRSIYIIIPLGVIGASIFGKLNTSSVDDIKLWHYLEFWNPGMSIFGGLFTGLIGGSIYLYKRGRRTKISILVYADCIVPNVLLGQSIGRWGNLFNHEILGKQISDSEMWKITWLPDFIWKRLFYYVNPSTGNKIELIQYREPLFLYESFATLLAWIIIVFVIINLGRWFSKKPWKIDPASFPCKFNKQYKTIKKEDMPIYRVQAQIKYKLAKNNQYYLSFWNVWNKAYYLYEPNLEEEKIAREKSKKIDNELSANYNLYKSKKKKYMQETDKIKNDLKITRQQKKEKQSLLKKEFKTDVKELKYKLSRRYFFKNADSSYLKKIHNPNNYFVIKSGVMTSCYFLFYSFIRINLEWRRNVYESFIKIGLWADYLVLLLIFSLALLLLIYSQFIAPKKFREVGWFYEKSY